MSSNRQHKPKTPGVPPINVTDTGQPAGAREPVHEVPPKDIQPKFGVKELKEWISSRTALKGAITFDPRLAEVVAGIPDHRAWLFKTALENYPDDVRVFLDYHEKCKSGKATPPVDSLKELLANQSDISFCVHPLTGMVLIADPETGHPEMMNEAGVLGEMQNRFSVGMSFTGKKELAIGKPAVVTDVHKTLVEGVTLEILREVGMPAEMKLLNQERPATPLKLVRSGMTPKGVKIPLLGDPYRAIQDDASIRSLREQLRNAGSDREADKLFDSLRQIEKTARGTPTSSENFVYEDGYYYTSIPLPSVSDLGGSGAYAGMNHDRAVRAVIRCAEGQDLDVFNTTQGNMGVFLHADYTALHDGREMKTSGGDPDKGGGALILRVRKKPGEYPFLFQRISDLFASGPFMKTD